MCIMTYLDKGLSISEKEFDNMWENNNHGGGMAVYKNGYFSVGKTLDKDEFHEMVFSSLKNNKDAQHLIHFRLASVGERTVENCHPFPIQNRWWMAHNGTFTTAGVEKTLPKSDTAQVAEIVSQMPFNFMKNKALSSIVSEYFSGQKVVFLGKTTYIWGEKSGTEDGNRWFSNTSFKYKSNSNTTWKNKSTGVGGLNNLYSGGNSSKKSRSTWECIACGVVATSKTFDSDLKFCDLCSLNAWEMALDYTVTIEEAALMWMNVIDEEEDIDLCNIHEDKYKDLKPTYISDEEWLAFCKATEPVETKKKIDDNDFSDEQIYQGAHYLLGEGFIG